MSATTDNITFLSGILKEQTPPEQIDLDYIYGLWVAVFDNPNAGSYDGYRYPEPLVEDIINSEAALTGRIFSLTSDDGRSSKVRFFITKGLTGSVYYESLEPLAELTDSYISGSFPYIFMPGTDFSGKIYRRYEITGTKKYNFFDSEVLVISGEDWEDTKLFISGNNGDFVYGYQDTGYISYSNESSTRYKFLYDDSDASVIKNTVSFDYPVKMEEGFGLRYRVAKKSNPLGSFFSTALSADGKVKLDLSDYANEQSRELGSSVVYKFSKVDQQDFSLTEMSQVYKGEQESYQKKFDQDLSITGIDLSRETLNVRKNEYANRISLLASGNYNEIYSVNVDNTFSASRNKITKEGYVMSGYSGSGIGSKTIHIAIGSGVYPTLIDDGIPVSYTDYLTESEMTNVLSSQNENLISYNPKTYPDDEFADVVEAMKALVLEEDVSLLKDNAIPEFGKTFLPNFPLPKKIVPKAYHSNYLNSGESYIIIPATNYSNGARVHYADKTVLLGIVKGEKILQLRNDSCEGLFIDSVSFCKGDTGLDDFRLHDPSDPTIYDRGPVTQIPSSGVIKKINYNTKNGWLNGINYFYRKYEVASYALYPGESKDSYKDFFDFALGEVKRIIGSPSPDNTGENSFHRNTNEKPIPRIFLQREIWTEPYEDNQILEFNRSFDPKSTISKETNLTTFVEEKLYCVQSYSSPYNPIDEDSFCKVSNRDEKIIFEKFLHNVAFEFEPFRSGVGKLSFSESLKNRIFRVEYASGLNSEFNYDSYSGAVAWTGLNGAAISIANQDVKNYAYHLYSHTGTSDPLTFNKSNIKNNDPASVISGKAAVLKFSKKIFQNEYYDGGGGVFKNNLTIEVPNANNPLIIPRVNIQVYTYELSEGRIFDQWSIFKKNVFNKNTNGNIFKYDASKINFLLDAPADAIKTQFDFEKFPNGPSTSKNYEGSPINLQSINVDALTEGLWGNRIIITEESKVERIFEPGCVLDFVKKGSIIKQSAPDSVNLNSFSTTRRAKIKKVVYSFYTKNLAIIGDAGSRSLATFNDGWEYELQYKKNESLYWKKPTTSATFIKDEIACHGGVCTPFYKDEDGDTHYLPMVAFEVNLPLYLDDNNYEFKIVKYEKLGYPPLWAEVIKKTNFIPIQVSWSGNGACSRFDIYQKDLGNNLTLLGTESSLKDLSYVIPDVRQSYINSGLTSFGVNNYSGYYTIIVSGVIASVNTFSKDLSGEFGFRVGEIGSVLKTNVNINSNVPAVTVAVSGVTHSPMLNFNNPESKNSTFEIDQNHNGYYFVTDSATSTLKGITGQAFKAYVANTGSSSCSVDGVTLNTNYVAAIIGTPSVTASALQTLPAASLSLNNIIDNDVIYLKNNFALSDPGGKKFYLINDSASIITGLYNSINYSFAGGKTFSIKSSLTALDTELTLDNINIQDDYIYSNTGLVNFDHSKLTLSSAVSSLPVYNASKNKLTVNDSLVLDAGSFNFVTWNGANAPSSVSKNYFDVVRMYLHIDDPSQSVTLLKDDTEIVITNSFLGNAIKPGDEIVYYFLKDELVERDLNVKIKTHNASYETISEVVIPSNKLDFKLEIFLGGNFKISQASKNPTLDITKDLDQIVILKGNTSSYIDLQNLSEFLSNQTFLYFINESDESAYFKIGEGSPEPFGVDEVARAYVSKAEVKSDIIEDARNHFEFKIDPALHLPSGINILNLDFCGTEIDFPSFENFTNKNTLLICKNRLIPNKVSNQDVVIHSSLLTLGDRNLIQDSIFLNVKNSNSVVVVNKLSILKTLEERPIDNEVKSHFYINETKLSRFTLQDFYNRKLNYNGKIFLSTIRAIEIQSFDEKNLEIMEQSNAFSFDYNPDRYVNGRLDVSETLNNALVFSYETEKGATPFEATTRLGEGEICANFAYDSITETATSKILGKNRLVKKGTTSTAIFPIYNKDEFFIAKKITNNDRDTSTDIFYEISAAVKMRGLERITDTTDVNSIIIPDDYGLDSLIIKNNSSRTYPIKTLSGYPIKTLSGYPIKTLSNSLFTMILPDQQIKLSFSEGQWISDPSDETWFQSPFINIKFDSQHLEIDKDHPLLDICPEVGDPNKFLNSFIDTESLDGGGERVLSYSVIDVFPTSPKNEETYVLSKLYCYGRKRTVSNLNDTTSLVNAFYLLVDYQPQSVIINKNEVFEVDEVYPLTMVERRVIDLLTDFTDTFIGLSDNVIFIPITSHLITYYLPSLSQPLAKGKPSLGSIISGKKIVFINLVRADASAPNRVINCFTGDVPFAEQISDLININDVLVYIASATIWTKVTVTSDLPVVQTVYATLKGVQGIVPTSTPEGADGSELVYLSNFNTFYVGLDSFKKHQYGDFYVYNSCNRSITLKDLKRKEEDSFLLNASKFLKISKNPSGGFKGLNLAISSSPTLISIKGGLNQNIRLREGTIVKVTTRVTRKDTGNIEIKDENGKAILYTEFNISKYENGKLKKIDLDDKITLDLIDLKTYVPNDKLFILNSQNSSIEYLLKNIEDFEESDRFYLYNAAGNNSTVILSKDKSPSLIFIIPSLRMVEISKNNIRYLETHSKGVFYIGNRNTNINYLLKSNTNIFLDNLFDDVKSAIEDPGFLINIAISSLRDDSRESIVYTYPAGVNYNFKFNYYILNREFSLAKNSKHILNQGQDISRIIKPLRNIENAGHYIINNNNSDIIITSDAVSVSSVFLVNNCTKDISAFVFVEGNQTEKTLFRNTVLVVSAGGQSRYLKKSKRREEFYSIFNPKTMISLESRDALFSKIPRTKDFYPISDSAGIPQSSYVKLLSKSGATNTIHLSVRDCYRGIDIPTDSLENILAYEVGVGNETIYKFLFFDPSESIYTLPGIENESTYIVEIDTSLFYNLTEIRGLYSGKVTEDPYIKYDGKKYKNGESFVGGVVTNYEIKYPNHVKLAKLIQPRIASKKDDCKKDEFGKCLQEDFEVLDLEEPPRDEASAFKEKILTNLRSAVLGSTCWLPTSESAFWQNSDFQKDHWTITEVFPTATGSIQLEGQTVSFVKCSMEQPDAEMVKNFEDYYSALQFKHAVANASDLTIGMDELNESFSKLQVLYDSTHDFITPPNLGKTKIPLGIYYPDLSFRDIIPGNDSEELINIEASVTLNKLTAMPTVEFEDFSTSEIIKLLNK